MGRTFKRLERVLDLEASQGYQNKAVVGGIRQFAVFWVEQARSEPLGPADSALVEQVSSILMEYGRLAGVEARSKAIEGLMVSLKGRSREESEKPRRQAQVPKTQQRSESSILRKRKEDQQPRPLPEKRTPVRRKQAAKPMPGERRETVSTAVPPADPDPEGLAQPVTKIRGVGAKLQEALQRLGASSINELLYLFPRRYDDYTLMKPIRDLVYGESVTVIGTIWETRARRMRNNQVMVQTVMSDGTASVQVTWFNQKWLAEKLKAGMQIVVSGKVDQYLGRLVFNSPDWEPLELEPLRTRRIVPVYPLTQGLNSNRMRQLMRRAVSEWSAFLPEPIPEVIRDRRELVSISKAIQEIHFPESQESLHRARRRLIFDELLLLQLGMQGQRHAWQSRPALRVEPDQVPLIRLQNALSFELTAAQKRVIGEIMSDMATQLPMSRLLQGDVGSGKTIVAAAALLLASQAGTQSALMAPTEILAEQHYASLKDLLSAQNVVVRLLTGSTSTADKATIYAELASGEAQVVIGTHALIQPGVEFNKLSLVVIDEQHRFGVDQRQALRDKGMPMPDGRLNPHLLVMSATPIPRTMALSLYGDLDQSLLDEMPPGRQEIKTRWLRTSERERAYAFIRGQVEQGRQAYIIYPLVEESEKVDAKAAVEEFERLRASMFPDLSLGLIHGRLSGAEKEATMRAFHGGELDILVATSVIEVGVDVPNSTVMLVDGANRFGLAQLHQFRGRVGRGEHQSYCLLIADQESPDAEARLKALEETNDGFVLAEKDLELRGPGEFFGRRQSGLPELRLASLLDMNMLEIAREEAELIVQNDPNLRQPEHRWLSERVHRFWEAAADVS
jgi:ATP-dependent DNA helicase RecG